MKARSLRMQFALLAAALVSGVLLLFAAGTYLNLYHEQIEALDLALEAEASYLAGHDQARLRDRPVEELVRFQPWRAIAIFDEKGHIAQISPALPEPLARAALTERDVHTARSGSGDPWRLKVVRNGGLTVVLAQSLEEVSEIVRDLLVAYLLSLPLVLVFAAAGGWWIAGRALRPLRELTNAAEDIRAEHLDRRVPVGPVNDEIRRLGDVLNAMLGRLEASFQQTQRFVADASHELRTPLTIMHGEIERLLRLPDLERSLEEKLLSLQEEIGRLDRITEHLLLLARFDTGHAPVGREPFDFSTLVAAACEDAEFLAEANGIKLTSVVAPGIMVTGDSAHLRRVVLSLLENATRYNTPGGKVECRLEFRIPWVELSVRNTGPGIPESARAQLFQRFFRADPARSRGGHGLGLSLAREIIHAHGGKIEFKPDAMDGWTEFMVSIPRIDIASAAMEAHVLQPARSST